MGWRPGQARAPYVGPPSGGAGADELVKITAADTTANYLNPKVAAGTGIATAVLNPGANEQLQISTTGAVMSAVDDLGIDLMTLSDGTTAVRHQIPAFWDDFDVAKPFWTNTDVLDSGDWQIDTTNDRLEGIAENNQYDRYRVGIEGDWDYAAKFTLNDASSTGLYALGNSKVARISITSSGDLLIQYTGDADVEPDVGGPDSIWLRIRRMGDTLYFYHKINDNAPWTLDHTKADSDMGWTVDMALDSADGAYVHEIYCYDNMQAVAVKAVYEKEIDLTDASTITVDASKGNVFMVTLGGNRTLGNPTNPNRAQKIIFKVKQDGTGSRTLSYDTKYRFSADLPSPTLSTGANKLDYLGFMYHEDDDKWDLVALVRGF